MPTRTNILASWRRSGTCAGTCAGICAGTCAGARIACAGVVACVWSGALAQPVFVREEAGPLDGITIRAITIDGVEVVGSDGTARTLAWDRVARVEGAWADEAAPFARVAESAWRARLRLSRSDVVGAEPLLEELQPQVAGRSGPTAAGVAIGLVRCRVGRGGPVGAVPALLDFYRAGGVSAGGDDVSRWWSHDGTDTLATPLIDGATGLCPDVPPIFVRLPGVQTLARTTMESLAGGGADTSDANAEPGRWRLIAELYLAAARLEAGAPDAVQALPPRPMGGELAWLWDIVASRAGEPEVRAKARLDLTAFLQSQTPAWQEAWTNAAIGRSLLREADTEQRWLGVSILLTLPARLTGTSPYVGGIAMAEAAVALAAMGDLPGAARVKDDMLARYPQHPASEWEPFAKIVPAQATPPTSAVAASLQNTTLPAPTPSPSSNPATPTQTPTQTPAPGGKP